MVILDTMKNILKIILMEKIFHMTRYIIMLHINTKRHKMTNIFHCQKYIKSIKKSLMIIQRLNLKIIRIEARDCMKTLSLNFPSNVIPFVMNYISQYDYNYTKEK